MLQLHRAFCDMHLWQGGAHQVKMCPVLNPCPSLHVASLPCTGVPPGPAGIELPQVMHMCLLDSLLENLVPSLSITHTHPYAYTCKQHDAALTQTYDNGSETWKLLSSHLFFQFERAGVSPCTDGSGVQAPIACPAAWLHFCLPCTSIATALPQALQGRSLGMLLTRVSFGVMGNCCFFTQNKQSPAAPSESPAVVCPGGEKQAVMVWLMQESTACCWGD